MTRNFDDSPPALDEAIVRALIEHIPLTAYIAPFDHAPSSVYTSPELESVLGCPARQCMTDPELFVGAVHPDDRERLLAERRRSRESGKPMSVEYRVIARDGSLHWIRDEASVIRDEAGAARCLCGFLRDVTQDKEFDEALLRSDAINAQEEAENRYRNLVEQIPLVTYVDEPAVAPSIYISPQIEDLVGYSADEWLDDPDLFFKLLHPVDYARVLADHERVFATGQASWSFEYRVVARDGRTVWIRDEAVVIKDDDGTPLYVQGFLMDITELKESEEALRKGEADLQRQTQYYESLLQISPVAVVTLDLEEVVTSWNPAAEELFGYSEAEALGQPLRGLILRSDALVAVGVALTREAMDRGSARRIPRRARNGGAVLDVEVLVLPIRIDGTLVGSYAIYHDLSELHRQKQYFESLLEISPTAIVTVDLDSRVTSWNPAAEKLFGY